MTTQDEDVVREAILGYALVLPERGDLAELAFDRIVARLGEANLESQRIELIVKLEAQVTQLTEDAKHAEDKYVALYDLWEGAVMEVKRVLAHGATLTEALMNIEERSFDVLAMRLAHAALTQLTEERDAVREQQQSDLSIGLNLWERTPQRWRSGRCGRNLYHQVAALTEALERIEEGTRPIPTPEHQYVNGIARAALTQLPEQDKETAGTLSNAEPKKRHAEATTLCTLCAKPVDDHESVAHIAQVAEATTTPLCPTCGRVEQIHRGKDANFKCMDPWHAEATTTPRETSGG